MGGGTAESARRLARRGGGLVARRSAGAAPGGGDVQTVAVLSLATQLLGKTWSQVSGLWGRKKRQWVYEEPHWVFFLNVVLIVLLRMGAGRWLARALARLLGTVQALYRRWSRGRSSPAKDAGLLPGVGAEVPGGTGGGQGESQEQADGARQRAEGEMPQPQPTQQQQQQQQQQPPPPPPPPPEQPRWLDKMVSVAEAPLLICLIASMACHVLVAALQVVQLAGHTGEWAAETITRLWVAQLLNYTLNAGWLVTRLLNTRLRLSKSRPSLKGDLSNLRDSAPATSRRYAQEAAATQLVRAGVAVVVALLCLQHLGVNISKLLAVTSLSGVVFSFLVGDILANLFGGFVIYITQPFAQGDWVQTPDGKVDGWIQNLGWYYTTVMRWEKRPHYIPNSTFGSMPIVNCSRMTHRRIVFEGALRMRDLDKIEDILADIRNLIHNHNDIDSKMLRICRLKHIDDFAVVVWVSCYIKNITLAKYLQVQESVLLSICSILRKYNTNWASALERFHGAGRSAHGEAELASDTNEFRRLLNARGALLGHEREIEDREEKLSKLDGKLEGQQAALEELKRDLKVKMDGLTQHEELVRTRQESLSRRSQAVLTKEDARGLRADAVTDQQFSIELINQDAERATQLHQEALQKREKSIQMAWEAMVIEQTAIDSEREALMQEKEMLERKRTAEAEAVAAQAEVPDEEPAAPEKKSAPASGGAGGAVISAGGGADTAGGAAEKSEGEEVASEEDTIVNDREQVALAIGGE